MANRREPIRRSDVRRCEKCGEDYSVTYKRCPFCNERPSRRPAPSGPAPSAPRQSSSGGGRRVASQRGTYGSRVNPLQVAGLVISLALLIAALYIVFTTIGPLLGGDKPDSKPGSQSQSSSASQSGPDVSKPAAGTQTPAPVSVESLSLDVTELTLSAGGSQTLVATVAPAGFQVTWSSSNEAAATVDQNGNVVNVNNDASQVKVTITAAAGDKTAECTVYCKGSSAGSSNNPAPAGKAGVVVGAAQGLRVRSGPGTNYEAIASLRNGVQVSVLEDAGGGWYKITFTGVGGVKTEGYVSQTYISVG